MTQMAMKMNIDNGHYRLIQSGKIFKEEMVPYRKRKKSKYRLCLYIAVPEASYLLNCHKNMTDAKRARGEKLSKSRFGEERIIKEKNRIYSKATVLNALSVTNPKGAT
ncbi:hypothetical protein Tco_0440121 [Tanacetum coccineum]